MLIAPDHHLVVSNLGWVDRGSLWTYDVAKDQVASLAIGDAKYLSLFPSRDTARFVVLHHYDGPRVRLTVHSFDDPQSPICSLERTSDVSVLNGDASALNGAPCYYIAFFKPQPTGDSYYLISLDDSRAQIIAHPLDWFDDLYDKAYQGIVSVEELPSGRLIISVQRDSHPVLYDPGTRQVIRKLDLAGRAGNPVFRLLPRRRELWADDYDTLLKLDPETLKVKASRRLQAAPDGSGHFIGRWTFNEEESLCLVPRPFSGDVLGISTGRLRTKYVARLGEQPFEAIALRDTRVIGRDWKSGSLLHGTFRRAGFG